MTGIKRLRKLIADIDVSADPELWDILRWGTEGGWDCEERDGKTLGSTLASIADQIKREQGGRVSRMRVISVVTEMARHVSGVEGMEDSPVARWARELREALGGNGRDHAAYVSVSAYDLLPQEDREAISWVREHGGMDYVKSEWRSRVPYDRYERRRQRLLGHIAECETALGRRREIISKLAHHVNALANENVELRRRAMPEGCEWPRYTSGEPVRFGDAFLDHQGTVRSVLRVEMWQDGGFTLHTGQGTEDWHSAGERVRRPAPKVLDADGVEIREGETVWMTRDSPCDDPLDKGDEVTVRHAYPKIVSVEDETGESWIVYAGHLTHERPDSWERIEVDAKKETCAYFGVEGGGYGCSECPVKQWKESCDEVKSSDLVRRCRALAERERGE